MNSTRLALPGALLAGAAALALTLTACGSDSDTTTTSSSPSAPQSAASPSAASPSAESVATDCPTTAPEAGGAPEWSLDGATGSIAVIGSTDTTAPSVDVQTPFVVDATQVQTLQAGDGEVVADTAQVSVCYMGVNGRDGSVFDSSYSTGTPVEFPLDGVVPGFQKAIAGQTVGSTVAVALIPADGYPNGQPRAGIEAGDTLIFAIEILGVTG